jgi:hypothetical protein
MLDSLQVYHISGLYGSCSNDGLLLGFSPIQFFWVGRLGVHGVSEEHAAFLCRVTELVQMDASVITGAQLVELIVAQFSPVPYCSLLCVRTVREEKLAHILYCLGNLVNPLVPELFF